MLSLGRPQTGFGVGPIPLTEVLAYTELIDLQDVEARLDLVRCIRAMDAAYLDHVAQQLKVRPHGQS